MVALKFFYHLWFSYNGDYMSWSLWAYPTGVQTRLTCCLFTASSSSACVPHTLKNLRVEHLRLLSKWEVCCVFRSSPDGSNWLSQQWPVGHSKPDDYLLITGGKDSTKEPGAVRFRDTLHSLVCFKRNHVFDNYNRGIFPPLMMHINKIQVP